MLTADPFVLAAPKALGAQILKLTNVQMPHMRVPQLAGRFPGISMPWGRSEEETKTKPSRKSGNARRRSTDAETAIDEEPGGLVAPQPSALEAELPD